MATKRDVAKAATLKLENDEPSLLFAIKRLIESGGVDFKEWWEQWEDGFRDRNDKQSNFKIAEWRKVGEKPFYKDVTPKEKSGGVTSIEYYPNKKDLKTSFFCSGTDAQIINQIIQIEHQVSSTGRNSISAKNAKPPLKGFPAIELFFIQRNEDVRKRSDGGWKGATEGTKIIRMPGFTDEQRIADYGLAELIKPSDVKRWAKGIAEQFGTPLYEWEKGRSVLSYTGTIARLQGLEGYAYVRTEAEGIRLFTTMLAAVGKKPDLLGFKFGGSTEPVKKFPSGQKKKILLGTEHQIPDIRPLDKVVFASAKLILPSIVKPILLVRGNVVVYND